VTPTSIRLRGSSRQALSWGLAALLLALPSFARAAFRPGAAVLDFQNVSAYSGHLLGRRAADQLALDLGATSCWRVIDRTQTRRAAAQRELHAPYAVGLMQELAHALGADMVITGAVQKLEVNPKAGSIKLTLLVEAVDQISGQSAMVTVKTGEAVRQEKKPEPTDVLIGEALSNASANAAKALAERTGLTMSVADPGDGQTLRLKPATGAQFQAGDRLLLYRAVTEGDVAQPGKVIATLMLSEVGPEQCKARVLAKAGDIHTDDIAVSICSGNNSK
jgi:hypothetical protein